LTAISFRLALTKYAWLHAIGSHHTYSANYLLNRVVDECRHAFSGLRGDATQHDPRSRDGGISRQRGRRAGKWNSVGTGSNPGGNAYASSTSKEKEAIEDANLQR